MFSIFTYHLDFGTSVAMEHNGKRIGEVADKLDGKFNLAVT